MGLLNPHGLMIGHWSHVRCPKINHIISLTNVCPYCWWKKSCTKWYRESIINYLPCLVCLPSIVAWVKISLKNWCCYPRHPPATLAFQSGSVETFLALHAFRKATSYWPNGIIFHRTPSFGLKFSGSPFPSQTFPFGGAPGRLIHPRNWGKIISRKTFPTKEAQPLRPGRDNTLLVGGWTNPSETYARQIGIIFPQSSGWKFLKKRVETPPPSLNPKIQPNKPQESFLDGSLKGFLVANMLVNTLVFTKEPSSFSSKTLNTAWILSSWKMKKVHIQSSLGCVSGMNLSLWWV